MIKLVNTDAEDMMRLIYDLNQDLKNAKKDSNYTIMKGKFIAFKTDSWDIVHNICTPKVSKKRKGIEKYVEHINGFVDGKQLFDFFKENKKFINEVELHDDFFILKTSIPEVEYKSENLIENFYRDIEPYREFKENVLIKSKNKKNLIGRVQLEKERLEVMSKLNAPILIETNGIKFKVTHKLFLGLKAKSDVQVLFFKFDKKKNLYLINIVMDNPNFKSNNYFIIVNY